MTSQNDHEHGALTVLPETLAQQTTGALGYEALIGVINEEAQLMEEAETAKQYEGEVTFLGALKDLVPDSAAEWTGGISPSKRMENHEVSPSHFEHFKKRVGDFYLRTTPGSTVRCIDGRTRAIFNARDVLGRVKDFSSKAAEKAGNLLPFKRRLIPEDSPAFEKLGPQIPGGTLAGGVSFRHATSSQYKDFKNADIASDAKTFGERSAEASKDGEPGYAAGDHQAHPDRPGLGCGAVDGIEATHEKINSRNVSTLYGLMQSVLGKDFNEDHFMHFIGTATSLGGNKGYFATKQAAIDYLKECNPEALPELIGEHNELALVINRVKNTTLHTDYLNAAMLEETGVEMQAFGYDLWYTELMAQKLFNDSVTLQERYVHCRLGMAVAAIMYLTDGTVEAAVRTSQSDLALAA